MDEKLRDWYSLWVQKSFRDGADKDYLAARLLNRNKLFQASAWSALQAVEKYLKAILLLSYRDTKKFRHDLTKLRLAVEGLPKLSFRLPSDCVDFLEELNLQGANRYLDYPLYFEGDELFKLDRCIWHIRRYCQDFWLLPEDEIRAPGKSDDLLGTIPKIDTLESVKSFQIPSGYLEKLLDDKNQPLRNILVWKNFYFGKYKKHHIKHSITNLWERPIHMIQPELLQIIEKVVFISVDTLHELRQYRDEKIKEMG